MIQFEIMNMCESNGRILGFAPLSSCHYREMEKKKFFLEGLEFPKLKWFQHWLQIMSRRRGGDPKKKRKHKRKASRGKKDKIKIARLISAAGTGYVYTKTKGKKGKIEKLAIKKYDPNVKQHVLFKEAK